MEKHSATDEMKRAILFLLLCWSLHAASPLTTVTGLVNRADATTANGTATISWDRFLNNDRQIVAAGSKIVTVTNGAISTSLYPNDTALPPSRCYVVAYVLNGVNARKYWFVPTTATPVDVRAIEGDIACSSNQGVQIAPAQITASGALLNQALCWGGSFWGPGNCGGGGGTPAYRTIVITASPMIILASTHQQGTNPFGICWSSATSPQIEQSCDWTRNPANGDLVLTYVTAPGEIDIYGGSGGGGGGGGGSSLFSAIQTGINGNAIMTIGTGGALTYSGTGTNNANKILGSTITSLYGNSGKLILANGTFTNGDLLVADANSNIIDSSTPLANVIVNTGSYANPSWITSLAWSKLTAVPSQLVLTNQANAYGAFFQDFSAGTLKVPSGAGLAPTASGQPGYDTTANLYKFGVNGTSRTLALLNGAFSNNDCPKFDTASGMFITSGAACGSGGGGATAIYQVTDFGLVKTSGTVETINGGCSPTAPCSWRIGETVYTFTASATATISGTSSTGSVYWCLIGGGTLAVKHNLSVTLTGSGLSVVTGQTSCGTDQVLWISTMTANVWDAIAETMDKRAAFASSTPFSVSGFNSLADNGVTKTIGTAQSGNTNVGVSAAADIAGAANNTQACTDGSGNLKVTGCPSGSGVAITGSGPFGTYSGNSYFPMWQAHGLPITPTWSWFNNPATAPTITTVGTDAIHILNPAPGGNGDNLASRHVSTNLGGSTFTIYAAISCKLESVTRSGCGISIDDGTKLITFGLDASAVQGAITTSVTHWTNATTYSSEPAGRDIRQIPAMLFFKISLATGTLTFATSIDGGASYDTFFTETCSTWFSAGNCTSGTNLTAGWWVNSTWTSDNAAGTLFDWLVQ